MHQVLGVRFCEPEGYLARNPLSTVWNGRVMQTVRRGTPGYLFLYPAFYVAGMIGYALELPVRICLLLYKILKVIVVLPIAIVCCDRSLVSRMVRELTRAFGDLGSGLVGCVCPNLPTESNGQPTSQEARHASNEDGSVRSLSSDEYSSSEEDGE